MPRRLFIVCLAGFASITAPRAQSPNSPAKTITVSIDTAKTAPPISPYIYGQFIEHIGDLVNRSLWAEMLDDRKFYNEINSKPSTQRPGRGGRAANSWRPIGPEESVAMDRQNPYVGVHTPLIRLAGDAPRGIQQAGLVLRKGKTYTGRIVLAGTSGSKVTVSLVWGDGASGRQELPIANLGAS